MKKQKPASSSIVLEQLLSNATCLEARLSSKTQQLQILSQRAELLATTSLRIRRSLDPLSVMNATALEVRTLLNAERVILYRFNLDWSGFIIAESASSGIPSLLGKKIGDPCFARDWVEAYQKGRVQTVNNIYDDNLSACHRDLLANMGIWAQILVPILQDSPYAEVDKPTQSSSSQSHPFQSSTRLPKLWGFLAVHECSGARVWHKDETDFLQKLSVQIAIALQQAQLHQTTQNALQHKHKAEQKLKDLNAALEQRVQERTLQLESAISSLQREVKRRKHAERVLIQKNQLAKVTLESIGDGVVTTDINGNILSLNPVAQALTGWSQEDAIGQSACTVLRMVNDHTREPVANPLVQALALEKTVLLPENTTLISRTGQKFAITDSASPIRNHEDIIQGAVMVFHDCTPARKLTQELSWQATHDALTGLINRREFEKQLSEAIARAHSQDKYQDVLCFLDLDQFKIVNDTCGHKAGDALLKLVADIFQIRVRSTDTLARLGGDEFGLLLKDCPLEKATQIAELLREQIQAIQFVWQEKVYRIGVSIGITVVDSHYHNMTSLLSAADSACYAAKAKGRNCIQVFRSDDQALLQQRGDRQWKNRIQQALEEDRFQLFTQPINPVSKDKTKYLSEILLRLTDEQNQLILPAEFMPAAEKYDLMPALDRWVVKSFLSQYEAYLKTSRTSIAEIENHIYTLNLSGASLSQGDLLPFLKTQIEEHNIPPQTICFEITETSAITNLLQASQLISELKLIGCYFALDDFWSGMCSMNYLKNLPVDFLKIDGSFVRQCTHNTTDFAIVECFNCLSHNLGIQTVAEWVEDKQTLLQLSQIGLDYVQGFGIARPTLLNFNDRPI
jgi:diguanylate cyclase (GGDEF)-like protein/PAS domain S-box-containing protein